MSEVKVGAQLVVYLEGGFEIGVATIEHIEDGKATISIPNTRVVMSVRQSLAVEEHTPEVDRIMAGLDTSVDTPGDGIDSNTSVAAAEVNNDPLIESTGEGIHNRKLDSSAID